MKKIHPKFRGQQSIRVLRRKPYNILTHTTKLPWSSWRQTKTPKQRVVSQNHKCQTNLGTIANRIRNEDTLPPCKTASIVTVVLPKPIQDGGNVLMAGNPMSLAKREGILKIDYYYFSGLFPCPQHHLTTLCYFPDRSLVLMFASLSFGSLFNNGSHIGLISTDD